MTGVRDGIEARLRDLVVGVGLGELRALVDGLDGPETKAARAWVVSADDVVGYPGPPEIAHLDFGGPAQDHPPTPPSPAAPESPDRSRLTGPPDLAKPPYESTSPIGPKP